MHVVWHDVQPRSKGRVPARQNPLPSICSPTFGDSSAWRPLVTCSLRI